MTQPAQSPDVNHLDLSFFHALQSAQWKKPFLCNIDQLINVFTEVFQDCEPWKIEKGSHDHSQADYNIPYIAKDQRQRMFRPLSEASL